ncbi:MAG TPA: M48 family metallopeptidase [Burkholderiales bacterium]|jgi:Zn-dependent protease with chaperone function|nr:M48 family metallopeptidase [Burkholderiales bacterium]
MKAWVLAVALATAAAGLGAQEGVDVKRSGLRLLPASTVERSAAQQYNDLMRQAAQKNALNVDRRQVERLRNIARALIPQSARFNQDAQRWKWEVNLLSSKNVNAFCMPGGKIAFFTGILEALQLTDDEVAAIMGHEIAHALLEHGRARMSEQVMKNVGISVASSLLGLGQLSTELLAQAANLAVSLPYARSQESDADLVGIELSARAGYDPRAAVSVWHKMQKASSQGAPGQAARGAPPQFLSTHPSHGTRIKDIEANLPRVLPLYDAARKQH